MNRVRRGVSKVTHRRVWGDETTQAGDTMWLCRLGRSPGVRARARVRLHLRCTARFAPLRCPLPPQHSAAVAALTAGAILPCRRSRGALPAARCAPALTGTVLGMVVAVARGAVTRVVVAAGSVGCTTRTSPCTRSAAPLLNSAIHS